MNMNSLPSLKGPTLIRIYITTRRSQVGCGRKCARAKKSIRKNEAIFSIYWFVFFVRRFRSRFVSPLRHPFRLKKSWGAPLPGKPSDRGLFGLAEDTAAAPITGAPAAHCFRLIPPWSRELSGQRPETSWVRSGSRLHGSRWVCEMRCRVLKNPLQVIDPKGYKLYFLLLSPEFRLARIESRNLILSGKCPWPSL